MDLKPRFPIIMITILVHPCLQQLKFFGSMFWEILSKKFIYNLRIFVTDFSLEGVVWLCQIIAGTLYAIIFSNETCCVWSLSCMLCQVIAGILEKGVITVTWFLMVIELDMYYSIPPATQILDSLNFFDMIFDCNSNQFVLPEDNDGIMSSSNERHKLSRTLACNVSEYIDELG